MSNGEMFMLIQQGIFLVLKLCAPVLGAALVIGLIVAIFQATTSIQEQTLTFLPKLVTILLVIALLGAWMLLQAGDYFADILRAIPRVTG